MITDPADHAAKLIRGALSLEGDSEAWAYVARALARLSPIDRASLAWAAMTALPPDHAEELADAIVDWAGAPWACTGVLDTIAEEARLWAEFASPAERDHYAVACVRAMTPARRDEFLRWIAAREAA